MTITTRHAIDVALILLEIEKLRAVANLDSNASNHMDACKSSLLQLRSSIPDEKKGK